MLIFRESEADAPMLILSLEEKTGLAMPHTKTSEILVIEIKYMIFLDCWAEKKQTKVSTTGQNETKNQAVATFLLSKLTHMRKHL